MTSSSLSKQSSSDRASDTSFFTFGESRVQEYLSSLPQGKHSGSSTHSTSISSSISLASPPAKKSTSTPLPITTSSTFLVPVKAFTSSPSPSTSVSSATPTISQPFQRTPEPIKMPLLLPSTAIASKKMLYFEPMMTRSRKRKIDQFGSITTPTTNSSAYQKASTDLANAMATSSLEERPAASTSNKNQRREKKTIREETIESTTDAKVKRRKLNL